MTDPSARTAADAELSSAFGSARAVGYAAGSPQMVALDHAEDRWTLNKRAETDDRSPQAPDHTPALSEVLSGDSYAAEDAAAEAAIAAAEAIASAAAAEVACEAAVTAQAAVDAARAAAARAAARARQVAADAAEVVAAVATARESPLGADLVREPGAGPGRGHSPDTERLTRYRHAATAAAASRGTEAQRVADRVVLVAEAAASAAVNAAMVVAAQLDRDVAAMAEQVVCGLQPLRISPDLLVASAAAEPEGAADAAAPTAVAAMATVAAAAAVAAVAAVALTTIGAMRSEGSSSHTIAAALNARGSRTARHRRWTAKSVTNVLERPSPAPSDGVPAAYGEVQAKPALCTGCMGSGQCWVCSGSGSLPARTGPVTACGVCSGRTLCSICHPTPARTA